MRQRHLHGVDLGRSCLARGSAEAALGFGTTVIAALDPRQDGRRAMVALAGRVVHPSQPANPRRDKILVVRPDHLGDLLFLTPALHRLRQGFPRAEIVGLVGSWGVPVLERNADLDRLMTWDFPWFDRKPRRSALDPYVSLLRLARRLRTERFDLAVQFRADFWWGALACRIAGIPEQAGYAAPITRQLLTQAYPITHGIHAADENLALAAALAGIPGPDSLHFPIAEHERRRAEELLSAIQGGRPLAALQVGAGAKVKLWPGERLAAAGRHLRDRYGAAIVVIGGAAESGLVRQVQHDVGAGAIGLGGATTLGELAAVLERCALAIGPDSGPLHLAVAVGTPTIHLFGPADARRFGPYGDPIWHRVIRSSWPCAPCNQLTFSERELVEHRCMAEISADEVIHEAGELFRRSVARHEAT